MYCEFKREAVLTWSVPGVVTRAPGQLRSDGREEVEEAPSDYHVVIDNSQVGNNEHGVTHTCRMIDRIVYTCTFCFHH